MDIQGTEHIQQHTIFLSECFRSLATELGHKLPMCDISDSIDPLNTWYILLVCTAINTANTIGGMYSPLLGLESYRDL